MFGHDEMALHRVEADFAGQSILLNITGDPTRHEVQSALFVFLDVRFELIDASEIFLA